MIKRTPEELISAARMDPERRDLYVEGLSDKLILDYLLQESIHENVRILPIDLAVEIDVAIGGAKGRVLAFAVLAEASGIQNLRFLVDSDLDPLLKIDPPTNTFLTDFPDMEGYAISERNLDKLLKVAHARERPSADAFHEALMAISSDISLLRFISKRNNLNLCITHTNKSRSISLISKLPMFDFDRFVRTVCQNTQNLQLDAVALRKLAEQAREEFEMTDRVHRIRGKDYIEVMNLALRKLQSGISEAGPTLLATIREMDTLAKPRMSSLAGYLKGTG